VEFDVRATADGSLVVHHDPDVAGVGPIATAQAVSLPDWVPTLDEALDACAGMATVNVEIKHSPGEPGFDPDRRLAVAVGEALVARPQPPAGPRLIVSSFDLLVLDTLQPTAPGLARGWLTVPGCDAVAAVATIRARGHGGLHVHHADVTEDVVAAARASGIWVATWTVDDPLRAVALVRLGVAFIITNVPDIVLAAVGGVTPQA
jgi:glycerophosphoryl diester phosphodiesterase